MDESKQENRTRAGFIEELQVLFESPVTILPLKGMSASNKQQDPDKRYTNAKKPRPDATGWQNFPGLSEEDAVAWVDQGGWLGLRIPEGYQLVDVDDEQEGYIVGSMLQAEHKKFHAVKTVRGYQFIFKENPRIKKNNAKRVTTAGFQVDYRIAGKGYMVLPTTTTENRTWVTTCFAPGGLDPTPLWLEETPAKERAFPVPLGEGARNNTLFTWLSKLREYNIWSDDELRDIARVIETYVMDAPLDPGERDTIVNQALQYKPSGREYSEDNPDGDVFTRSLACLKDCPADPKITMPFGWRLNSETGAVCRMKSDGGAMTVSPSPVVIIGRYENLTDGTIGLTVAWQHNGRWRTVKRSRDVFLTNNKIVELAAHGLPVSSANAKELVKYLAAFESYNAQEIPVVLMSEQFGWSQDGGFLLGRAYLDPKGVHRDAADLESIAFNGADAGDEQFADGFLPSGDLNVWLSMIEKVQRFPRVMLGVYASFAAPLLQILKANTFIFEWAGETSKGKTTALRVAASVWGNPEERGGGIIKKWNATPVSLERTASICNNLPLFLDETKEGDPRTMPKLVYQLASGQGRGRGSVKGAQQTRFWRTVIFSTGEQRITSFSNDGGAAGRAVCIDSPPFGGADQDSYKLVQELEYVTKSNYGHAGKVFLQWVMEHREEWPAWRERLHQIKFEMIETVENTKSVGTRLVEYFALLRLVADLLHQIFGWQGGTLLIDEVWREVIGDDSVLDRPLEAIRALYSVAWQYENDFDQYGEWKRSGEGDWVDIKFLPHIAREVLVKSGYEPSSIFKSWKERGWLDTTANRGFYKRAKRYGSLVDFIVVKRQALEA